MSWFSKKKEETELPELPELPGTTDKILFEESSQFPRVETRSLPSLPDFNQEQVRQGGNLKIDNEEMQRSRFAALPLPPPEPEVIEKYPINPQTRQLPQQTAYQQPISSKPIYTKPISSGFSSREPIYVRLDKFETTVQSLEEIKNKIENIENLLIKTKELKSQEEREIEAWEKEVQIIKSRIESIDKNVFREIN